MGTLTDGQKAEMRIAILQNQFWTIAIEYYISGRRSCYDGLLMTGGVMFHHCIEYLLKGQLAETESIERLKDHYGHSLIRAWQAVKKQTPANLKPFDSLIAKLETFDEIRYPGDRRVNGPITLSIGSGVIQPVKRRGMPGRPAKQYHADLRQIDALVAKLMQAFSMNPAAYMPLPESAVEMAVRDNASADPSWRR